MDRTIGKRFLKFPPNLDPYPRGFRLSKVTRSEKELNRPGVAAGPIDAIQLKTT
jgi:hypothetical protein